MSVGNLVDAFRKALKAEGFEMKLHVGRDRVAKVFFGKSYSAAIAAETAGKLQPPRIIEAGLSDIQAKYGVKKRELVARLGRVFLENLNNTHLQGKVMKATEQIGAGLVPPLPQPSWDMIQEVAMQLQKEITPIRLNQMNFRQGKHFESAKVLGTWYALSDEVVAGVPIVTAQCDHAVLYVHDADDIEGDHQFLEWKFDGREWSLGVGTHMIIDEDESDDTLEEIRLRAEEL